MANNKKTTNKKTTGGVIGGPSSSGGLIGGIIGGAVNGGISSGLLQGSTFTIATAKKWGIPAKYQAAFVTAINNLSSKSPGLYSSSGSLSATGFSTMISAAAAAATGGNGAAADALYSKIASYFGVTKNTSSTTDGWGKATQSLKLSGGNYETAAPIAGGSGTTTKNKAVIPNTVSTSGGGTQVSIEAAANLNATASARISAYDQVLTTLDSWGMLPAKPTPPANKNDAQAMAAYNSELKTWQADQSIMEHVKNMVNGATQQTNQKVLLDYIRSTNAYKQAFPGLDQRNASTGIMGAEHMTEAQYQQYVASIRGTAQQYGLPKLTNAEIASLVENNVSASEFNERVTKGYVAAANADPATKAQLAAFGINTSDLAKYYLDPKNSLAALERKTAAATIAGYAQETGLKGFTTGNALELADRVNLGTGSPYGAQSMASIENSLLAASKDALLSKTMPGGNTNTVSTQQVIGSQIAGFAGTNQVAAQVQVERAEQAKASPFEKGGGYAETAKGVVGLGSART